MPIRIPLPLYAKLDVDFKWDWGTGIPQKPEELYKLFTLQLFSVGNNAELTLLKEYPAIGYKSQYAFFHAQFRIRRGLPMFRPLAVKLKEIRGKDFESFRNNVQLPPAYIEPLQSRVIQFTLYPLHIFSPKQIEEGVWASY